MAPVVSLIPTVYPPHALRNIHVGDLGDLQRRLDGQIRYVNDHNLPCAVDAHDGPHTATEQLNAGAQRSAGIRLWWMNREKYDFWALTRYDDVSAAIKDHETFSSARGVTLDMVKAAARGEAPMGKIIISLDPPEHERMRKLVNRVFTPRAVASLESLVRETIDHYVKQLDPSSFDAVADFAALFPVEIITSMLGVPAPDRQQLRHWLDKGLERNEGIGVSAESMDAVMKSAAYYYELIQERRKTPQDDMISRLTEAEVTEDGETRRLDDIEITGFCTMLGGAGAETVTKLVGNAVVVFADNPDQWQKLQDDRSRYRLPSKSYCATRALRNIRSALQRAMSRCTATRFRRVTRSC